MLRDLSAVLHGVAPTLTGYFLQGGCKFGFYEYFKGRVLSQRISKGPLEVSALLACAGVAELIASFMLCPLEVTKIYMLSNPDAARRGDCVMYNVILFFSKLYFFYYIILYISTGMTHCMRQICIESGALGLFQGTQQHYEDLWFCYLLIDSSCVYINRSSMGAPASTAIHMCQAQLV